MAPLNAITLNVQGLNIPQKQTNIFRSLASAKAHIGMPIKKRTSLTYELPNIFAQLIPKLSQPKQRGVLIAFHRSAPFSLLTEIKDPEGRYFYTYGTSM